MKQTTFALLTFIACLPPSFKNGQSCVVLATSSAPKVSNPIRPIAANDSHDKESCKTDGGDDACMATDGNEIGSFVTKNKGNDLASALSPNEDICVDSHKDCPVWGYQGHCKTNPGYMRYNCALSCNTCADWRFAKKIATMPDTRGIISSGVCMDKHFNCKTWAASGECINNADYMNIFCRRSCMICVETSNFMGKGQVLPKTAKEAQQTQNVLDDSIHYMNMVNHEKKFTPFREKCYNKNENCMFWASLGECENNYYMKINCAPACKTCEMVGSKRDKECSALYDVEPLWKPGDLDAFFESVVDDSIGTGEYLKYNPKALSRPKRKSDGTLASGVEVDGPWIVLLENFITNEEADRIVEIEKMQGDNGNSGNSNRTKISPSSTLCNDSTCMGDPLISNVLGRIANITKSETSSSEHLQILRYEPGQSYMRHNDYLPHQSNLPCGPRIMTLHLYLNDVEKGGSKIFPTLDITVSPEKGSSLLWPIVKNLKPDEKDPRTDHEDESVLEEKYVANAWIHNGDFKMSQALGCQ